MEIDKLAKELQGKAALQGLADSAAGRKIAGQVDSAALQSAMKRGDTETLKQMLSRVLSTPEGKALAEQVQKAVRDK